MVQRVVLRLVTVMVPNSLGPAELILKYGTQAQQQRYLPDLAAGIQIPCFALTEPDAGCDATALSATGIVCKQQTGSQDTLNIRLNWEKRYITLAPVATVISLAVKLYDPDHLLGEQTDLGITLCLVPTDLKGIDIGKRHFSGWFRVYEWPDSRKRCLYSFRFDYWWS